MFCREKSFLKSLFSFLFILLFFFVAISFSSCAKKTSPALREAQTLREAADLLKNHTEWSKELSSSSSQSENTYQSLVKLTPLSLIASNAVLEKTKIYPTLKGFANLNIENYTQEQKKLIDDFCIAILKDKNADSFIKEGKLYTLVLFRYNLQKDLNGTKTFSNYIKGEPFIQNNLCQCPIRFIQKDGKYVDIFLYLTQTQAGWKIEQIAYKQKESE